MMEPQDAKKENNLARYLFHEGTNYQAYDYLGAHMENDAWVFRVWAPKAKEVYVTGDFCQWKEDIHQAFRIPNSGIFECTIKNAKEYDAYKFVIVSQNGKKVLKGDPYGFHFENKPGTASKLYRYRGYEWGDLSWMQKRTGGGFQDPINIYEMHLGSWQKHADDNPVNYKELGKRLVPYLKEMGYTHVEFMPVSEYPYDKSWGYQIIGYFAPTSRYGIPKDFMALIDELHQHQIGVILDWVPAHFPKDASGLYEFDGGCLYEYEDPLKREHPDWGTRIFDYGRNEVRSFLISNACYWFREYHIDGLRVDAVSSMLYLDYGKKQGEWRPNRYGERGNLEAVEFLQKLNTKVFNEFPGIMMIAEESTSWPKITKPVHEGGIGFSYKWNMGWMNDSLRYIQTDPLYRKGVHDALTFSMTYAFSENYILPLSHDEVVHGKKSMIEKMPGKYEQKFAHLRSYMAYWLAHPGKKLSFMGSEFAQFIEWNEEIELDWKLLDYPAHKSHQNFIKDLNRFYLSQKALWEQDFGWEGFQWVQHADASNNVIAFYRIDKKGDGLLIVCNFSGQDLKNYRLNVGLRGKFAEAFSTDSSSSKVGSAKNVAIYATSGTKKDPTPHILLDLPPFSTLFYAKKGIRKNPLNRTKKEGNPGKERPETESI